MSTIEMNEKVKDLRELKRMAEELADEINALQDDIKAEMSARGVDELAGLDWKATYKEVTSNRLDTSALKKALPEIAERFSKSTTTRRFILA
jgi:predicted phage-related endonuclease